MKPLDTTFPNQPLRDVRIRIWKEKILLIQRTEGETEGYISMFHLVRGGNGREKIHCRPNISLGLEFGLTWRVLMILSG